MRTIDLLRGVALSALAASALAVAACGDKDAAQKAGSPQAPASSTPPAAAPAPVLQTRSETRQFKDWRATCGNDGTCWAFGFAPEFAAGWVRIALQPGPDARPEVSFGYWPDGDAPASRQIGL
ncbi:MAG: DUF1176 domain-containing protein, partial [Alphaproteobacteria bacterium]|nr:DUF1176 domain-containing protein [Alphaproteobacteria bacterium]